MQQIQEVVQVVAEAIASALNMEVEIFDNNLVVVGATGRIRGKIGFKQQTSHVSEHALKAGSSCVIDKPGEHYLCSNCMIKKNCFCTAALVSPISLNSKILGTISLLSFDHDQRNILLSRQGQYLDYIARMGELLAGQAQLHEALHELSSSEKYFKTIIDSVNEGIIAVNSETIITHFNKAAERFLNVQSNIMIGKPLKDYFPDSSLPEIINNRKPVTEKEAEFLSSGSETRIIYSAYPIIIEDKVVGAVKTFKDSKTITQFAGSIASRHEAVTFNDIKGESAAISKLIDQAKIVAHGRSTVLLQGESGTGKELFARAIYQASPFNKGPFQVINCSAIPESLLESELFGYEEGAFTGARKGGKPGKFELADGGTLFLDEIGDMPLFLQAKLLRVLENSTLERVGGTKQYSFNIRIIAATNQVLEKMVQEGTFRQDLYYRLNVIPLYIPNLRERPEDILPLSSFFLEKYSFLMGKTINTIDNDLQDVLSNYSWPGNVRELENVIEYAVNFEITSSLSITSLPPWLTLKKMNPEKKKALKSKTDILERDLITEMLKMHGTSLEAKQNIADQLGISLTTLYRKMRKNNIE